MIIPYPSENWNQAEKAWRENSRNLYHWLRDLLKAGDREKLAAEIALLEGWAPYFEAELQQARPELQHQWRSALRLACCAWLAAKEAAGGDGLGTGLAPAELAWAVDAVGLLRPGAAGRRLAHIVEMPVALCGRRDGSGVMATLTLEILEEGTGQVYQHPEFTQFTYARENFEASLRLGWQAARGLVAKHGLSGGRDVRWRLTEARGDVPMVEGPSAGAAAALGAALGLRGQLPDQELIVFGQCQAGGQLESVAGLAEKARLVAATGRFDTVVVPDENSRTMVNDALAKTEVASTLRVMVAATLPELVACRSQLIGELVDYCQKLVDSLDWIPWPHKGKGLKASQVAVPMRVLKETTRLERPDERRHASKDGDAISNEGHGSWIQVDSDLAELNELPLPERRQEEVPWAQERLWLRRAIILAGPGSGKSFLTQITAVELAKALEESLMQRRSRLDLLAIPMHFTLTQLADPERPNEPTAALTALWGEKFKASTRLQLWLRGRLATPQAWLLLDSLDEVKTGQQEILADRLKAMATQGWQARILLTCRPANYSRDRVPWPKVTEYSLAPFNRDEILLMIRKWFADNGGSAGTLTQALAANYSLVHAAQTPLIASFICVAHEESPMTAAMRRTDLYLQVVWGLVHQVWKGGIGQANKEAGGNVAHAGKLVRFLVQVALPLFKRHPAANLFTDREILAELARAKPMPIPFRAREANSRGQELPPDCWPELLQEEFTDSGILVVAGLNRNCEMQYSFAHRSVLEYLVAQNLAELVKVNGWAAIEPLIEQKSWSPAWQEVVVFLVGLLEDPVPLLALLANSKTDDLTKQRLCLAGRCLLELGEQGMRRYHEALLTGS